MQIMTIVEGKISIKKAKMFEAAYAALKNKGLPKGLIISELIREAKNPGLYRVQTLWESWKALEDMKNIAPQPVAPALFKKFGAKPKLKIFEVSKIIR